MTEAKLHLLKTQAKFNVTTVNYLMHTIFFYLKLNQAK